LPSRNRYLSQKAAALCKGLADGKNRFTTEDMENTEGEIAKEERETRFECGNQEDRKEIPKQLPSCAKNLYRENPRT
jgi:hypothetical protein